MRRGSWSAIVVGTVFVCLVGAPAMAQDKAATQDKPADNMSLLREKARIDKKVVVAAVLELTEGEAQGFWPVYNAYQSDMVAHYGRIETLLDTYGKTR